MKAAHRGLTCERLYFVICVLITEIWTIDGGQKDTLLRRANIKIIYKKASVGRISEVFFWVLGLIKNYGQERNLALN